MEAVVHGRRQGLLTLGACEQGKRLLLYGGEREEVHMDDAPSNSLDSQDQDEVDCVPLRDVALLDPCNLWVPITLAGELVNPIHNQLRCHNCSAGEAQLF